MFTIKRNGIQIKNYNQYPENIGNMNVMYSTLKTFGHLITNLAINYETFSEWECEKINGRISKFLSNSLTQITLNHFNNDAAKNLIGPFNELINVTIHDSYITANVINMTNVFPAVRYFHFAGYQQVENIQMIINQHFPHLNEIKETMYDVNAANLKTLLQLNPQLNKLSIQKIGWKFLKMVTELLPQLAQLEIDSIRGLPLDDGDVIHFERLRTLKLSLISVDLVRLPLTFGDNFKEIIDLTPNQCLLDIVLQNKNLKKVITRHYGFERIIGQLPNLEEFHTGHSVYEADDVGKVIRFIKTTENLKKIELESCAPRSAANILERIKDKWQMINGRHYRHFIFIRSQ